METKVSRIYNFAHNGFKIDLNQIICIGAIDKSLDGTIFIPVFCKGFNKPIHITLGHAIGKLDQQKGERITQVYNDFVEEWNLYIIQKNV